MAPRRHAAIAPPTLRPHTVLTPRSHRGRASCARRKQLPSKVLIMRRRTPALADTHELHARGSTPSDASVICRTTVYKYDTKKTTERDMTGNFPDPATHRLLSPPANPRPRLHKSLLRLHKSKEITIREKCRHRLRLVQTADPTCADRRRKTTNSR